MSEVRTHASVHRLDDGTRREHDAGAVVALASVGKVLLLAEVARGLVQGDLDEAEPVPLTDEDRAVGGTGMLRALSPRTWTVADLAVAVATVSDNAATNALLRRIGLEPVRRLARQQGLMRTSVHDRIRDQRGPGEPETFASGTVAELAAFMSDVESGRLVSADVARRVKSWMTGNVDRSLVADPISREPPGAFGVANKTGTDTGVRADVGIVTGASTVAYAVVSTAPPGGEAGCVVSLREWGERVARLAAEPSSGP
ncbi:beta-lactamase class A [Haloactinopolyspora alba]|uniref:Beta-lactamase class A n=1 Tax=Haloactinopolyspora alba TaxID=648780 RepID=A0A2P8EG51_9ACTN|nr:serine hydrolase [Haloactinopolyspora alba]PSL08432.1 beta-lactamase class A [Haloactinopolyspora alba]